VRRVVLLGLVLLLAGCRGTGPESPPLNTVSHVDLDRYTGRWYEVAKIPHPFQRQCVRDTTAEYVRKADGTIAVVNRCRKADGTFDEARAIARVADSVSNAKLEVNFFSVLGWRPVWGDYWILALGPDYDYAIVGEGTRRYGWILSRTPALPDATRALLDQRLRTLGYSPEQFENSVHTAGR